MGGVDLTVCSQFSWNLVSIQHENNSSKAYVVTALFVGLNIFKKPTTFVLPWRTKCFFSERNLNSSTKMGNMSSTESSLSRPSNDKTLAILEVAENLYFDPSTGKIVTSRPTDEELYFDPATGKLRTSKPPSI